MAKSKFDTSFAFGANVKPKAQKPKGGKRGRSEAQRQAAALYMKPRRR